MPLLPVRPLADPDFESLSVQETLRKSGFLFFLAQKAAQCLLNVLWRVRYLITNVRHVLFDSPQGIFP